MVEIREMSNQKRKPVTSAVETTLGRRSYVLRDKSVIKSAMAEIIFFCLPKRKNSWLHGVTEQTESDRNDHDGRHDDSSDYEFLAVIAVEPSDHAIEETSDQAPKWSLTKRR